jgi:fused signal recognition particle receptor
LCQPQGQQTGGEDQSEHGATWIEAVVKQGPCRQGQPENPVQNANGGNPLNQRSLAHACLADEDRRDQAEKPSEAHEPTGNGEFRAQKGIEHEDEPTRQLEEGIEIEQFGTHASVVAPVRPDVLWIVDCHQSCLGSGSIGSRLFGVELVIGLVVVALLVAAVVGYVVVRNRSRRVLVAPPATPQVPSKGQASASSGAATGSGTAVLDRPVPVEEQDLSVDADSVVAEDPAVEDDTAVDVQGEVQAEEIVRPRFRDRLSKARGLLGGYFGSVLGRSTIDAATWDDLEEALVRADVGINTTTALLDDLKARVKSEGIKDSTELLDALKADLKARLASGDRTMHFEPGRPNVWLFVGVNGVGKTTTIGKIGKREAANGRSVIMAAGDTFRAAAAEQLGMWASRTGADLVRANEGADPGSVIFDAVERAAARNIDLVLGDTAGRLQTKTNLMEELRKIRRIADKEPGKVTEVLLVLDATTGQNGLIQAKQFGDVADLTGVVLTKLDGTAKGGIAFAIQTELGIPIKLVGLGEGADDLIEFDPDEYVEALFN